MASPSSSSSSSSSAFVEPGTFSQEWSDITLLQSRTHCMLYTATRYGRRFLLKALREEHRHLTEYQLLHEKEFRLAISLNHPNIAATYSYEQVPSLGPCIVQEYIDGDTLSKWLGYNPTKASKERVFGQLLDALEYLHNKQLVHHDLKGDNILITRNGQNLKLIDFGLSDTDDNAAARNNDPREDLRRLAPLMQQFFPKSYRLIRKRCANGSYPNIAAVRRALEIRRKMLSSIPIVILLMMLVISSCILYTSHKEREAILNGNEQMLSSQLFSADNWTPLTEVDSVVYVVGKFYCSQTWEQQLEFVMDSARVRPMMQKYYAKGYGAKNLKIANLRYYTKKMNTNLFVCRSGYDVDDCTYIIRQGNDFKIDWEATVTYNPLTLYELEQTPGKVVEWRANRFKYNLYAPEYQNDYWERIYVKGAYFYCLKQNKAIDSIHAVCADNNVHQVILKIRAVKTENEQYIEIVDFVKEGLSKYY